MTAYVPDSERSNHTLDYFRDLVAEIPSSARTALDVGCGEGFAARQLARRGIEVTALDLDEPSLAAAREQDATGVRYVHGDFLTAELPGKYDVITALAVLHHVDTRQGLLRCRELLAPGGTLLVVGLAASDLPRDLPREVAAAIVERWARMRGTTRWEHPSPTVWPPPVTYRDVKRAANELLPGSRFKRRLLWRYTLVWRAPGLV